ncbi:MAG: MFS transporter [Clostridiales bacterium]|nr:MFS transporter [Clostridiales bacterium]
MSKNNINRQLGLLYISNFMFNISIAGAAWVLLLVSDGYSLVRVGFAETVFHITSLIAEIPSGMFADVFGRKKSLILSCVMSMLSALVRGFVPGFAAVCVSVGFAALSYNFISGSDSAIAYDTFLEAGQTDRYDRYISTQTAVYRISNGIATLFAGAAVIMGNRNAQILSLAISAVNMVFLLFLRENKVILKKAGDSLGKRIKDVYKGSFSFLKGNKKVAGLIFRNALVGGIDVLLLFFLQAKLPMTGIPDWTLGPLLFIMSMGGILGALAARKVKKVTLGKLFIFCITLALLGLISEFTGVWYLMTAGGFFTAFADDLIQIRSDIALNRMVPAEQRATLISVNSFCFSVLMIFMSPLAGFIFSL